MKKISIITGVRNEEETVAEVYKEIKRVFAGLEKNYDYEHIFMDNCSTDATVSILKEIAKKDKKVKILVFSKNFGVLRGLMTGYKYATGDAVICYEANLKDPADLITTFIKHWEDGYSAVYGVRNKSREVFLMALVRRIFYRLINSLSEDKPPLNSGGFRLVDRKIVDELVKIEDYRPYIRGLMASVGFNQIGVEYIRGTRPKGKSKSTFSFLIDFAINGIVSSSIAPVRLCTLTGIGLSVLSFLMGFIYLILKLSIYKTQISVAAGFIILMLLFLGIQLFFIGMVGEYVVAIHSQVRKKPYIIIKEKVNFDS
ncbi:MAG: glycosyltransferase family 2 protein [Candidatus Aureabacteria bacterium]|nr:glycosyltransferase family 2 protein [Candidatus Auribacterota bacterium]